MNAVKRMPDYHHDLLSGISVHCCARSDGGVKKQESHDEEENRVTASLAGLAFMLLLLVLGLMLVHVLQNLAAPASLGPSISAAFIATLMGVGSANAIFLPIASRLKAISAEEMELRMMTLEGILSIQAGDNPRLVSEKLMSYLPPAERAEGEENVAPLNLEAQAA